MMIIQVPCIIIPNNTTPIQLTSLWLFTSPPREFSLIEGFNAAYWEHEENMSWSAVTRALDVVKLYSNATKIIAKIKGYAMSR